MQSKLKPGDTFTHELDGTRYKIKVMSVADEIQLSESAAELEQKAQETKDATHYYRSWLLIVETLVADWDRDEPVGDIANLITRETAGDLAGACLRGNSVSEDEAKN